MSHSLPPSGTRRERREMRSRAKASTSSSAFAKDERTAFASRCAAASSGKSASPPSRSAFRRRWDRWEIRDSVSRTTFPSQDDPPVLRQPFLDLLEEDAGVRLGVPDLPDVLLEERLRLPVELLLPLDVPAELGRHRRDQGLVGRLRADEPLRLPPGEDRRPDAPQLLLREPHLPPFRGRATHSRKSGPMTPLFRYLSIETAQGQSLSVPARALAAERANAGIAFFAASTSPASAGGSIPSNSVPRRYGSFRTPSA